MPTIDANVWVSAFDTKDRFHDDSVVFLRSLAGAETITRAPAIVVLEVACAIARRYADPAMGHKAPPSSGWCTVRGHGGAWGGRRPCLLG